MRTAHYLKPVKGDSLPSQFISLGIVSHNRRLNTTSESWESEFKEGCAILWRCRNGKQSAKRVVGFSRAEDFWTLLYQFLKSGTSTWVYCFDLFHALGVLGCWKRMLRRELIIIDNAGHELPGNKPSSAWKGFYVLSDPPSILCVRPIGGTSTVKFIDPRNYGVQDIDSLARPRGTAGESLEGEPPSSGRSNESGRWRADLTDGWLVSYIEAVKQLQLGTLQVTAGSQVINGWKRSHLTESVLVHDCDEAIKLERAAYYGGRCECRVIGEVYQTENLYNEWTKQARTVRGLSIDGPIYQYDINSAFPFAANLDGQPVRLACYMERASRQVLDSCWDEFAIIGDVEIQTDSPIYPLRRESDAAIVFPTGRFRTVLADPELRLARDRNHIVDVHGLSLYNRGRPFGDYCSVLWDARLAARSRQDRPTEDVIKRLMVSLVGKLCQKNRYWTEAVGFKSPYRFGQWFGKHPDTGKLTQWRTFADLTEYLDGEGEHGESLPALAAHITSTVRVLLWHLMEVARQENVYYYDTDSIWTNTEGAGHIDRSGYVRPNELGGLKEPVLYRSVKFWGIKRYEADGRLTCAGLSKRLREDSHTKAYSVDQKSLSSFLWGKDTPAPILIGRSVKINTDYQHGVVNKDGTVVPFKLPHVEGG